MKFRMTLLFFYIQTTNCKIKQVFDRMRLIRYTLLLALLLESCASVDKYNAQLNMLKNEKDLKSDVDYIQHKLEKLHPDLYHYIAKKDLDYKFDSLRSSLTTPMTSSDFYFRLSPVIASIKQGHTQTFPLTKKLKPQEKKIASAKGTSPLAQFDFELFNNKLYIVKNNSNDSTIKAGTEVVTINGIKPLELMSKFSNTFTSDGYNRTFVTRRLAKGFSRFFYYQNGIMDSVYCHLNYNDTIRFVTLKKLVKLKIYANGKSKEKKLQQNESQKRKLLGYDPLKRMYSKQLSFPVKDSSVAILRISDFTKGAYKKFYKKSFQQLDSLHCKALIIDLRDNTGGRLREIYNLYSYLADSTFHLIDKSEVTSKTSLWHFGYYDSKPILVQAIRTVSLPVVACVDIYTYFKTIKGIDQKYQFPIRESKPTHPKATAFKGKVYVLINGGSFSASCLLSSNLQGSKRAIFVGQETGGAYNGCVAGIMPVRRLPKSKLTVSFGLLGYQTPYKSEIDGRGIFPDVEISPTLLDRMNGTDPELQWVLNDVKKIAQAVK